MTASITCDHCGTTLVLDGNGGEDQNGEVVAWLRVGNMTYTWDACTRECAHVLLDGPVREVVDEHLEVISQLARTIREDREGGEQP
jgi:hypothetical protein